MVESFIEKLISDMTVGMVAAMVIETLFILLIFTGLWLLIRIQINHLNEKVDEHIESDRVQHEALMRKQTQLEKEFKKAEEQAAEKRAVMHNSINEAENKLSELTGYIKGLINNKNPLDK